MVHVFTELLVLVADQTTVVFHRDIRGTPRMECGNAPATEWELVTEQTWCGECERDVCCVWRSAQGRKEEAAHRVKQETMDNELMNLEK